MIIAKVRRMRKTSMNNNLNKRMANVALDNTWLGKKVVVIGYEEYKKERWLIKRMTKKLLNIKKLSS